MKFHILLLDGVSVDGRDQHGHPRFQRVNAPDKAELESVVHSLSERVGSGVERQGLLVRDMDSSYLTLKLGDEGSYATAGQVDHFPLQG